MVTAMARSAPKGSRQTKAYGGNHELLVVYGAGNPDRQRVVQRHIQGGGIAACLDLAYWDKKESFRLSFNNTQPLPEQILATPDNPRTAPPALRSDYKESGHVVIVGLGGKSRVAIGLGDLEWELATYAALKTRFPVNRIVYRPKGEKTQEGLPGCRNIRGGPIEAVLNRASLVVCKHSNVAVDACVAGIPVECEAGAAHALYRDNPNPSPAERARFLNRLTWWQWQIRNTVPCWEWISHWY